MSVQRCPGGGSLIDVLDRVLSGGIVVLSTATGEGRRLSCDPCIASVDAAESRMAHVEPMRLRVRAHALLVADSATIRGRRANMALRGQLDRLRD